MSKSCADVNATHALAAHHFLTQACLHITKRGLGLGDCANGLKLGFIRMKVLKRTQHNFCLKCALSLGASSSIRLALQEDLLISELSNSNHHHWPQQPFLRSHFPALLFPFLINSLLQLERRRPPSAAKCCPLPLEEG